MYTPDICSSTICRPPNDHCHKCSHAHYEGAATINGKTYRFGYNPLYGVDFMTKNRAPFAVGVNHPVWDAWHEWYVRRFETKTDKG